MRVVVSFSERIKQETHPGDLQPAAPSEGRAIAAGAAPSAVRSSLPLDRPSHARGPYPAGEKGRQPPPSSVKVNTQGREPRGSGFETCSVVWYPVRGPCGAAINT